MIFSVNKLLLIFCALFISFSAYAVPEKDTGNLGEIRQSILSVEDFQRIYGDDWVLMKGQNIENTDLYRERLWRDVNLPDARGMFLRSMNHARNDGRQIPEGDQVLGAYLADTFKSHSHPIVSTWNGNRLTEGFGSPNGNPHLSNGLNGQATGPFWIAGPVGDYETRPRHILVNTFVKVNRTPDSQQTQAIVQILERLPQQIVQNERLAQTLRRLVQDELRRQMRH